MADSIETLSTKTDAELMSVLGYDKKIAEFKKSLEEAKLLSGEPRKNVAAELDRMLSPSIYPGELHHAVEREKRKAAKKTTPESMMTDSCCGCGPY